MKYTTGPWVTADAFGPSKTGTAVQAGNDGYLVCSCTGYFGREGAQANARLIAAAPELLEALREAWTYVPEHHGPVQARIKAAIAKATGEQA